MNNLTMFEDNIIEKTIEKIIDCDSDYFLINKTNESNNNFEKICNNKNISSIFINSCKNGDIERVKYILSNYKINTNIGIVSACQGHHFEVVKLLLENGADVNYIDTKEKNWNPIIATMIGNNWDSSKNKKDDIINELINHGCTIEYWVFDYVNNYKSWVDIIKQSNFSNFEWLKNIF